MKVVGVDIVNQSGDVTWAQSMTKLRFFELTQYQRLIYFDADGLIMRRMDHLFSLPSAESARHVQRAGGHRTLCSEA